MTPTLFLTCYIIPLWLDYKSKSGATTFTYSISDLWAACVGLLPTILLAAQLMPGFNGAGELLFRVATIIFVLLHQVLGMIIGKLKYGIRQAGKTHSSIQSALWIIAGALSGLIIPIGFYFLLS